MARKHNVERSWFITTAGTTMIGTLAPNTDGFLVIDNPDGSAPAGVIRLVRFIGLLNVYVQGAVAGDPAIHLWHGLWHSGNDGAASADIADGDANEGDWLWREPVALDRPLFSSATGESFAVSQRIDWQVRGGRGTVIRVSDQIRYAFTAEGSGQAGATIRWSVKVLELYAGT